MDRQVTPHWHGQYVVPDINPVCMLGIRVLPARPFVSSAWGFMHILLWRKDQMQVFNYLKASFGCFERCDDS